MYGCVLSDFNSFPSQNVGLREDLYRQVTECAPDHGLDDCLFPSFFASMGLRQELSASDVVYGYVSAGVPGTARPEFRVFLSLTSLCLVV